MFKSFIYFFFIFFSFCLYANDENPVFFLEKVIAETKPALITKNDFVLEQAMEKYIDFEEMAIWICGKNIWVSSKFSEKEMFLDEAYALGFFHRQFGSTDNYIDELKKASDEAISEHVEKIKDEVKDYVK